MIACDLASHAARAWAATSLGTGRSDLSVTSTWNGRLVSAPDGSRPQSFCSNAYPSTSAALLSSVGGFKSLRTSGGKSPAQIQTQPAVIDAGCLR
jgi:hypothetical protein